MDEPTPEQIAELEKQEKELRLRNMRDAENHHKGIAESLDLIKGIESIKQISLTLEDRTITVILSEDDYPDLVNAITTLSQKALKMSAKAKAEADLLETELNVGK